VKTDPGGALARRPLHFIWIVDGSGSMAAHGKMQSLNNAIRDALPQMRGVARSHPHAEIFVSVLAFADGARWVTEQPVSITRFQWQDLAAEGYATDLEAALRLLASDLGDIVGTRALPPNLVLISDGRPTDDWRAGLDALFASPWGQRAVRNAVAIGKDADWQVLNRFIDTPGRGPLTANNPEDLVAFIEWVSTVPIALSSEPGSIDDEPQPSPLGESSDVF
jgi:uncharacterized protein YegL